jgi:hypothetical protein
MRGGGINATTSRQTKDYHGGSKSNGDGDGNGECRAPPSRDFAVAALILAAEAAAALIATMPMAATAVSPSLAAHLSWRGAG